MNSARCVSRPVLHASTSEHQLLLLEDYAAHIIHIPLSEMNPSSPIDYVNIGDFAKSGWRKQRHSPSHTEHQETRLFFSFIVINQATLYEVTVVSLSKCSVVCSAVWLSFSTLVSAIFFIDLRKTSNMSRINLGIFNFEKNIFLKLPLMLLLRSFHGSMKILYGERKMQACIRYNILLLVSVFPLTNLPLQNGRLPDHEFNFLVARWISLKFNR